LQAKPKQKKHVRAKKRPPMTQNIKENSQPFPYGGSLGCYWELFGGTFQELENSLL